MEGQGKMELKKKKSKIDRNKENKRWRIDRKINVPKVKEEYEEKEL